MNGPHCRCDAALALADAAQDVLETTGQGQEAAMQHLSDALQIFGMAYAMHVDCCPLGVVTGARTEVRFEPPLPEKLETTSRFSNALEMIAPGACSPSGIASAIVHACRQVRGEGGAPASDPAVRLMASQLAWVCQADPVLERQPVLIGECQRQVDEVTRRITKPIKH